MLRRMLFWMLLPWVIPQALYVRQTAPRFQAASGPPRGSTGACASLRLLGIGDSIIAGVGVDATEQALAAQTARALTRRTGRAVSWMALGQIGATAAKVRRLLAQVPAEPFDVIVVSVGINDVTGLSRSGRWRKDLGRLVTALEGRVPDAVILVAGLPPLWGFPLLPQPLRALLGLRARTFDAVARALVAGHPRRVYVPLDFEPTPDKFAADGYHPSPESYGLFGDVMAQAAARCLADVASEG